MDQIKIGKFIAEMRKEQNLTQQDLAEKLGISNKTVSKWECGNGMPDYAVMESLCDVLQININEVLSGEKLQSQEYSKKAEENMMSLIQESSKNYKRDIRTRIDFLLGILVLGFVLWLTIVLWSGGVHAVHYFLDAPTLIFVLLVTIFVMGIAGVLKDFVKAFPLALRGIASTEIRQVKKSLLAVKTAMLTVNAVGLGAFGIAIITFMSKLTDSSSVGTYILISLLSIMYSLAITLVLIPIYARLKVKLIEV